MKKLRMFVSNFYRVTLFNPIGRKHTKVLQTGKSENDESEIRNILQNDPDAFDPDPEIYRLLAQKVASRKRRVSESSFAGIITLLFSIKNVELKMAVLSFILIISLGINPGSNYQVSRKISPFSLADTLKDSIRLEPQLIDHLSDQR